MVFNRKDYLKKYQREWIKKRRSDWIKINGPCKYCGSNEQLQVDHIDPSIKVTHAVWSWSQSRRVKELRKCQVLCKRCHHAKTISEVKIKFFGRRNAKNLIHSDAVVEKGLIEWLTTEKSQRKICEELGFTRNVFTEVLYRFGRPDLLEKVLLGSGGHGKRARLLIERMQDRYLPPQLRKFLTP